MIKKLVHSLSRNL